MEFLRTRRDRHHSGDTTVATLRLESVTALTQTSSDADRRPPLERGTQLLQGRFSIAEIIGQGGEGVVYRAWDRRLEQNVALKTLHVTDPTRVPILKREFRFLRDLVHPALVQLHELIVDRDLSFFTMTLIEGQDFLQEIGSETELRSRLQQLADVLGFLHAKGRIHRDIKATNVLVKDNGNLVLVDFGVALNLARPGQRATGRTGTPRYMAPELLRGQPATEKSDAYSVGVLLFEALTGQHPSPSGRTDPLATRPILPSSLNRHVPEDLDELCASLLEPDPERRASVQSIIELDSRGLSSASFPVLRRDENWFTGRVHELGRLRETFERMQESYAPIVAFVEAASGMGKTALIDRFLSELEGTVILRSKCSEHEMVPHKAIDGIVEDLVDYLVSRSEEELEELIPLSEAGILVQLFPEFSRLPGFESSGGVPYSGGDFRALRLRAYLALAGVLGRLSDQEELIIVIDDLQWGDLDSGRLLREVFAGPERPNCLLILAYRQEEKAQSECLQEVLVGPQALASELNHTLIVLEPLLTRESTALVGNLGADLQLKNEAVFRLVAEANGSPLLLTELVSHLREFSQDALGQGTGIDDIVRHRIEQLSPSLREAFGALCCAGAPLPVSLMSALGYDSSDEILTGLTHARLAHIRRGGQELEVFHDSVRSAMLELLGDGCARYHATLARALVMRRGDAAEIARHFDAAGMARDASLWAETAAEQANRSFALTRAVELYRLALRDPDVSPIRRDDLLLRLARALAALGRGFEAAPLFLELSERVVEPLTTELQTQAAAHFLICGEARRGMKSLAQVHAAVGLSWPKSSAAALRFFLAERTKLRFALLREPVPRRHTSVQVQAQLEACRAAWHLGFISILHASGSSARYLRLAAKGGDRSALALGYGMEAIYRSVSGSQQRAVVEQYRRCARELLGRKERTPYEHAFLHYVDAHCHFMLGEPRLAIVPFQKAEQAFSEECRDVSWELNSSRLLWSQALSALGRLSEWGRRLRTWQLDAEERGDMCLYSATKIGQGRHSVIVDGDPEQARSLIHEGSRRWEAPVGGVHHFMERFANVFIDAYSGKPASSLERLDVIRREMVDSHMMRAQVPRVQLHLYEGYACVEMATELPPGSRRRALLGRARRAGNRLLREQSTAGAAFGTQILASADLVERPTESALRELERAEQLLAAVDLRLHRAAVCARIGELRGGEEGRRRIEEGKSVFAAEQAFDFVSALSAYTPRVLPS